MKTATLLLSILLCSLLSFSCTTSSIQHVSTDDMQNIVEKPQGTAIIDARLGSKWDNKQRIHGAKALSLKSSDSDIQRLYPDKEAKIITYCGSMKCPMSATLAKRFKDLGYKNISEYSGGLAAWKEAGGAIDQVK